MHLNHILSQTHNGSCERISTIAWTGKCTKYIRNIIRRFDPMDAFLDISPPGTGESIHLKSGIMSLRPGGRVSLMGAYETLEIPTGCMSEMMFSH